MYENLYKNNIGNFIGDIYWSSSESSDSDINAWCWNFWGDKSEIFERGDPQFVRACRAF